MTAPDKTGEKVHVTARETERGALEAVHATFVLEGLLEARRRSWEAFDRIREKLEPGMTEPDARKLCRTVLEAMGSPKDWHKPYVRFGPGTALTFHDPTQRDYRLVAGDAVYLDLGPVWPSADGALEYEGDVGATFAFGANPEVEACAATARRLFEETQAAWRSGELSGQALYADLATRAAKTPYRLDTRVEGHRLADYPHSRYAGTHLARVPFAPTPALWVLEVQLAHPSGRYGAFYEDILQ